MRKVSDTDSSAGAAPEVGGADASGRRFESITGPFFGQLSKIPMQAIGGRDAATIKNVADYINALGAAFNETNDRIAQLNTLITSANTTLRGKNEAIGSLRGAIVKLNAQLTELRGERERLEAERTVQGAQLERLTNDYRAAQAVIEDLKKERDALIGRLEVAGETNAARIAELNGKIEESKQCIQQFSEKVNRKNAEIEALQRERDGLKSRVSELNGEVNRLRSEADSLRRQVRDLEKKNGTLESQVRGLNGRAGTLEKNNASLQSQLSALEGDRTNLAGRVGVLAGQNEALRGDVDRLRSDVQERDRMLATLQSQRTGLERDIAAKTQEIEAQRRATVANAARWLGSLAGICRRTGDIIGSLEAAKAQLEGRLDDLQGEIGAAEDQRAADGARLAEQERALERLSGELSSAQNSLRDKDSQLRRTQGQLDHTNAELESVRQQLTAANENLQTTRGQLIIAGEKLSAAERAMGERLAAVGGELSAVRGQLQCTEERLAGVGRERNEAKASSAGWQAQLVELTRQNRSLVDNVKRLEGELRSIQARLTYKEQEFAGIQQQGYELFEQCKATQIHLDTKIAEFGQVQEENERLRAQLGEAEREMEQYRAALGNLINALQGEVAEETDEIVLGGLRKLWEVASSLPGDIAVNLHVRCLNQTIESIAGIKDAIALLEDKIFHAPTRRWAEFEENLQHAGKNAAVRVRYIEKDDPILERFCKIGAGIDVDYGDRDLNNAEFLAVANLVVKKSFETLLQTDAAIGELRALVGTRIDVDTSMNQYFSQVMEKFAAYVQEGHSFYECFNKLGELVVEARNQVIEDVKNFAAVIIVDAIKTNDLGTGDGQISQQFIENFVRACGGQGECFARMVNVEANEVARLAMSIDVPGLGEAIENMRAHTEFAEVSNVSDFLLWARIRLAQTFEEPMSVLAQHRFVDQGNGTWKDPDAIKDVCVRVNAECNFIANGLHFISYLSARNPAIGGVVNIGSPLEEVSAIVNGQIFDENFQNFFAGERDVEGLLLQLNNFILEMLQPVRDLAPEQFDAVAGKWTVKLPGEEMVVCFHKVRDCIAGGDISSFTFRTSLNKFFEQFILTVCDSLENLQHACPDEFAPTFYGQESLCMDMLRRFS